MSSEGPNRRTQLIVLAAFAALIVVAAIVISVAGGDDGEESSGDPASADSGQVEQLFDGIAQSGTFLGDPDAKVVITEFADLQCPFCGEFARNALPEVIERHVRTGEVAMELQLINILGQDSAEAAEVAAAAALQNRLWQFADTFYLNQGEENSGYVTDEFLREIADATPGLDANLAFEQRDSPEAQALVDGSEAEADQLGVASTPSFYMSVDGAPPREIQLQELTADAITEAIEAATAGNASAE